MTFFALLSCLVTYILAQPLSQFPSDLLEELKLVLRARIESIDTFQRQDENDNYQLLPTALSSAFHDCGGIDLCDACINHIEPENGGLDFGAIYPIKQAYQNQQSLIDGIDFTYRQQFLFICHIYSHDTFLTSCPMIHVQVKTQHHIISSHSGQAGVEVGNSGLKLCFLEHGLDKECELNQNNNNGKNCEFLNQNRSEDDSGNQFSIFLYVIFVFYVFQRSICLDLEPTFGTGASKRLFPPEQLLNAKEDALNSYAPVHCPVDQEIVDLSLDIHQSFLILKSVGSATTGGFDLLLEKLCVDYEAI